jgi:hypothetical protein
MASAWGGAFGRAWGNAWGRITEAVSEVLSGGVLGKTAAKKEPQEHLPYKGHPWIDGPIRRYIEEVEPEIVEAVIEVVAEVAEKRTVQNKDVEAAQAEKALRERLVFQNQVWKELYAQLIRLEYERREQEYEDAQIAMLLFEM